MEWVETTAKSVEDAKELALDQLGVTADEAEFEVLEEPRPGLFGRVRGEARVRARVRPTTPRAKVERRDRRKGRDAAKPAKATDAPADGADEVDQRGSESQVAEVATAAAAAAPRPSKSRPAAKSAGRRPARSTTPDEVSQEAAATSTSTGGTDVSAQQVGEEAARFLDGLAEAFGIASSTSVETDGDEIEVKLDGADVGMLIGQRGATLLAIQDLTRVVAQRRLGDHETRLRIDIGGYRERRRAALSRFTLEQAEAVKSSGKARVLESMPSADRKVIHDTIAGIDGVSSRSEGEDPHRRVVIVPSSD